MGGPPHEYWVSAGLNCCTYATWYGGLNGYVQLPAGHPDLFFMQTMQEVFDHPSAYDYASVPVHGGWTYGPDVQGWIGFDTLHGSDYWDIDTRRRLVPESAREELEFLLEFEERCPRVLLMGQGSYYLWTEELVRAETTRAAEGLAALIKETELRRN